MREYLFFLIICCCYLYVPAKYTTMIYQQNHYHLDRYTYWLKQHVTDAWIWRIFLLLCFSYVCFLVPLHYQQEVLLLILLVISYISYKLESNVTYRIPLKFTFRIKRYTCISFIFYCLFIWLFQHLPTTIMILCAPLLYGLPFAMVLIAGHIAKPLEEMIQNRYVQAAKQQLQQQTNLTTIGITGSYGKTSVKNILYHLLSEDFDTLMTPKSYNNKMGITLTIRKSLRAIHEIFICEMGADHVHEIYDMMHFVEPQIGIVTAIGPQHLQTFHSIENIVREKMYMIEELPASGIGFLNADNAYIQAYPLHAKCKLLWFGKNEHADYQINAISYHGNGMDFAIRYQDEMIPFSTSLLGEHNIYNICCAVALAHTLGVSFNNLQASVKRLPFVKHRLQIVSTHPYTLIDDAYNANPVGAKNALDVLANMKERTIIVTPGMIDLGSRENLENKTFGRHMAHCVDEVILVGKKATRQIKEGLLEEAFSQDHLHVCDDFTSAMNILQRIVHEGDVVLLENDLPDAFAH